MNANTVITIDRIKGTATVDIELAGNTELDHELLAAFFTERRVSIVPTHEGDKLGARVVIEDEDAFEEALHNLENRKRAADGRPSIEDEAAAVVKHDQEYATAVAASKQREADAAKESQESRDRIEKLAAKEIADRTLASAKDAEAPKPASEPDKVQ